MRLNRVAQGEETLQQKKEAFMKKETKEYRGLRGWLIIVGISIFSAILEFFNSLIRICNLIFSFNNWEYQTTEGTDYYIKYLVPTLICESIIYLGLIIASIYMTYLFFNKRKTFPKWYIAITIIIFFFIIGDAFATKLVFYDEPFFDSGDWGQFMGWLFRNLIWTLYMLVSKRVKATFIN